MRYVPYILIIVLACSCADEIPVPVEISGELEILNGIVESDSEEGFLGIPISAVTGPDNNLFVADGQRDQILKYDTDGKFIQAIASQGQGPEEIPRIGNIFFDKDTLVIAAHTKMLRFMKDGRYIDEYRSDEIANSVPIIKDDSEYVMFKSVFTGEISDRQIIHSLNSKFEPTQEPQVNIAAILKQPEEWDLINFYRTFVGEAFKVENGRYLLAPLHYEGIIYEISRASASGNWSITDSISTVSHDQVIELLPQSRNGEHDVAIGSRDGSYKLYKFHSYSRGLFRSEKGDLLHFLRFDTPTGREMRVEVIGPDKEYKGYVLLGSDENLWDNEGRENVYYEPVAMDGDGNIWMMIIRNEKRRLVKTKLNYE